MKSILVTGLCTLHWGRLQYGNIGNYYIIEPLFRQLHQHFKDYKIRTTFQMDAGFAKREDIEVLPMKWYYEWNGEEDVLNAEHDVTVAQKYVCSEPCELTPYIKILLECEYVIDVSGDMWGDNAEHVGHKRFIVDCLKMKAAQILKKKTVLYAVTPGPFSSKEEVCLAREVFSAFDLVVIREKVSRRNLLKWGFPVDNVIWAPCPSFLFQPNTSYVSDWLECIRESHRNGRKVTGLTFGGFNMPYGPYDMWPREDAQYDVFIEVAEHMINSLGMDIVIFSHTNGFELPPNFKLINGRDYLILEKFYQLMIKKNDIYQDHVTLINEPLLPCNMKYLIGNMDMLVTGRVHASVAATSQCIPTVYVEYDKNVIYSDKMTGFSEQLGMEEFVCEPGSAEIFKRTVTECHDHLSQIREQLKVVIPEIKEKATEIFTILNKL